MKAFDVLDEAHATYNPVAFYALLSGGHDSLTATKIAQEWATERDVVLWVAHINTGIGIPETNEFVRSVCRDNGWPLRELRPPVSYEALIMEYGFPGPGQHGLMYQRLKERCLRQLLRESKTHVRDRVMLISGVRSQESTRRMKHVDRIQREGATVWAAPIHDWSALDCSRFIDERGLPRNPVKVRLEMSGECLCGSYAKPDEMKDLELWYPEVAARIHALEDKVQREGLRACRWGHGGRHLLNVHRDQEPLFDVGPLCRSCEA